LNTFLRLSIADNKELDKYVKLDKPFETQHPCYFPYMYYKIMTDDELNLLIKLEEFSHDQYEILAIYNKIKPENYMYNSLIKMYYERSNKEIEDTIEIDDDTDSEVNNEYTEDNIDDELFEYEEESDEELNK
jgi:hypothetical protein